MHFYSLIACCLHRGYEESGLDSYFLLTGVEDLRVNSQLIFPGELVT